MASRFLIPFGASRGLTGRGDPFFELHREMNRLFDDVYRTAGGQEGAAGPFIAAPRLDVHETDQGLEISAELPGVSQDDIDLRLDGDMLTIRGEKRKERKDEQAQLVERSYGSFQRSIQLPFAPDPDQVQADCNQGVLTIRLPQPAEPERSRRIRIGRSGEAGGRMEGRATSTANQSAIGRDWDEEQKAGRSPESDRSQEEERQNAST